MVTYEVALETTPELAAALERYMRERHIPDIMTTGCFTAVHFERSSPEAFRTRYVAATREDLDRYLDAHTPVMRADFAAHFPEGITARRAVWDELQRWPAATR